MADVRSTSGTPVEADFGGFLTPTPSTPIVIDSTTGAMYAFISGSVTLIASPTTTASSIIEQQSFGRHVQPTVWG